MQNHLRFKLQRIAAVIERWDTLFEEQRIVETQCLPFSHSRTRIDTYSI